MGKLVKLILVIVIIAIGAYALMALRDTSGDGKPTASDQRDERPRLEEKYGFTGETVGD
jgi:hypothetical protein